jgi:predicted nuclease with TOPRIM domain
MLEKGAVFYKEKKEVVARMKATKEELDGQLSQVKDDIKKFSDLKSAIAEMERELVEEKLRVKALSDELRKPINVHRWRRLQDTNADAYAMIKRVRELQKQLIIKAGQVEHKDKTIQEVTITYTHSLPLSVN